MAKTSYIDDRGRNRVDVSGDDDILTQFRHFAEQHPRREPIWERVKADCLSTLRKEFCCEPSGRFSAVLDSIPASEHEAVKRAMIVWDVICQGRERVARDVATLVLSDKNREIASRPRLDQVGEHLLRAIKAIHKSGKKISRNAVIQTWRRNGVVASYDGSVVRFTDGKELAYTALSARLTPIKKDPAAWIKKH